MRGLILLLVVGAISSALAAAKFPFGITSCKNDDKLNDCSRKIGQNSIKKIVVGDPKWKIPKLDPFRIEKITLQQGNRKNAFVNMTLTDMDLYGLSNTDFTRSVMDTKRRHVAWTFRVKPIYMISDYVMDGRFLLVPITGSGKSNITVDEGTFTYYMNYTLAKKNGVDYMKVTDSDIKYQLSRLRFKFENLFNGDKTLGDGVNQMLNDNWKEINEKVGPAVAKAIVSILQNLLESIASVIPYHEIIQQ